MSKLRRFLVISLVISIAGAGLPQPAQAAMLATERAIAATDAAAGAARARIATLLERRDLQAQLEARGVNAAEVKARVAALTDQEAAQLAERIDQLPAGADAGGALISALLIIFIVLLITDILGVTKVFPFTRPIK
ncbi:MAG: PA2779 family protein [Betaproteobacteria bacterium]|nr:PA2779 family protein [Betaproteobacteria bacterium]